MTLRRKISMTAIACACCALALINVLAAAMHTQCGASGGWNVPDDRCTMLTGVPVCGGRNVDPMSPAAQAVTADRAGRVSAAVISVVTRILSESQPEFGDAAAQILDQLFGGNRYANCVSISVAKSPGK